MIPFDQVGEELQKESDQQQTDVHTVDIGIGCYDDFVISQTFQTIFDIESGLKQVEFFILVNDLFSQAETVQRLTAQTENSLQVRIAALCDGSARRVTLGDENTTFFRTVAFGIVQVDTAITQFLVMQIGFLGPFACQLGNTGNGLAFFFRFQYLTEQGFRSIGVLVQVVIQLFLDEVADKFSDCRAFGTYIFGTQLGFCLALEHRLFYLDADGGNDTRTDVRIFEVLVVILFNDTSQCFTKSGKMCSSLCRVLTVHERVIFFAVLVAMGDNHLDVFSVQVNDRI